MPRPAFLTPFLVGKATYRPLGAPDEPEWRAATRDQLLTVPGASDLSAVQVDAIVEDFLRERHFELPRPWHHLFAPVYERRPVLAVDQAIQVDRQDALAISLYLLVGAVNPDRLALAAVRHAMAAGYLVGYNPEARSLEDTPLSRAVSGVLEEADLYRRRYEGIIRDRDATQRKVFPVSQGRPATAWLDYAEAAGIWAFYLSHANLYRRLASLYAHIRRDKDDPLPTNVISIEGVKGWQGGGE